jgi:DNA excision repair protein ERCC-2
LSEDLCGLVQAALQNGDDLDRLAPLLELSRLWMDFCTALQYKDSEQFQTYKRAGSDVIIKVTCCDANQWLRKQYGLFANVVAFSATLKPFDYYCSLSGFDKENSLQFEAPSPFPPEHRKVLIIPQVSTKYSDRAANYQKICDAIQRITAVKKANYIVFFPSFDFLEQIINRVIAPGYTLLKQERGMTKDQVASVLQQLKAEQSYLLFAVQGGIFSEGVDFPGNMASGAIVVGPGLPSFELERELLREYYEKTYGFGFDYAYAYPAMTKVIQSAGRVVRSEQDRGLIVLLDKRFLQQSYMQAMPADWFDKSASELVSNSILQDVRAFWDAQPGCEAGAQL